MTCDATVVCKWLQSIGLPEYTLRFDQYDVAGFHLIALSDDELNLASVNVTHLTLLLREALALQLFPESLLEVSTVEHRDRIADGIEEPVKTKADFNDDPAHKYPFYGADYQPPCTVMDFLRDLPVEQFPKDLIDQIMIDFKKDMAIQVCIPFWILVH